MSNMFFGCLDINTPIIFTIYNNSKYGSFSYTFMTYEINNLHIAAEPRSCTNRKAAHP